MFTDSLGNVHWEFWEGITLAGRKFQGVKLFALCREFGTGVVKGACIELDILPYDNDLELLEKYIERQEAMLV